jgi:hypothetical protein
MPSKKKNADPSDVQILQPNKGTRDNPTPVSVNVDVFGVAVSNQQDDIVNGTLTMTIDGKPQSYSSFSTDRVPLTSPPPLFLVKFRLPITVPEKTSMTLHVEDPQTNASDDAFYIQQEQSGFGGPVQIKSPASGSLVNANADPFGVTVTDLNNNTMDGTLTINGTPYKTSSVVKLTNISPFKWLLKFSVSVTVTSGTPIAMHAEDTANNADNASYTQM